MSKANKAKPANPYINPEAERGVLGALLIAEGDCNLVDRIIGTLQASDFDEPNHETIFRGLSALHDAGQPLDTVLLDEWLKNAGELALVTQAYVHQLADTCVNAYAGPTYAQTVLDNSIRRQECLAGYALGQGNINAEELIAQLEGLGQRKDAAHARTFMLDELMREELPAKLQVVPDFLPEGLCVLGAKQKIGKSWLVYALAMAVASGGVALGKHVEAGDVLYLALEDGKRRLQDRARKQLQGQKIPTRLTLAIEWERLNAGGVARIGRWLRSHKEARLVVIDVLAKVRPPRVKNADPYLEDYAAMSSLKALADRHHVAVLVVHHTRKASAEDVYDELNGTMGIAGAADTVWILQRQRGEDTGILHITGREIEQEGQIALRFDKAICTWQLMSDQEVAANRERSMSAERRDILDVLRESEKPLGPSDIACALGIDEEANPKAYAALRVLLGKMVDDGQIARPARGTYTTNDRLQRLQRLHSASDTDSEDVTDVNEGLHRLHSVTPDGMGNVTDVTNVTSDLYSNTPQADVWVWPDHCDETDTRRHEYNGKTNAVGQPVCIGCGQVKGQAPA